jgi:hypothetical protein
MSSASQNPRVSLYSSVLDLDGKETTDLMEILTG